MSKQLKKKQKEIRKRLWELLGDLPKPKQVRPQILQRDSARGMRLEKFMFNNGLGDPVPGYFITPKRLPTAPAPAILYFHCHGGNYEEGKGEMLRDLGGLIPAEALTRRGYLVMVIDFYCFGERIWKPDQGREGEWAIAKRFLWEGRTLWGMMIHDQMLALDYLSRRPEVDPKRIGGMGFSMGSTMSWWMAALDDRIKATVSVCCLTRYSDLARLWRYNEHGIYYYVPGILKEFDTEDIVTPIAPRPWLTICGEKDTGTPISGVRKIHQAVTKVYRSFKAEEKFGKSLYKCGHKFLPKMWEETFDWFEEYL